MKKILIILILGLALISGCISLESEEDFYLKGTCRIISIDKTENSISQVKDGKADYEGFEIIYEYKFNKTVRYSKQLEDGTFGTKICPNYSIGILKLSNSLYPGSKFINKYQIKLHQTKVSEEFVCDLKVRNEMDLFRPLDIIFKDIDIDDYFETAPIRTEIDQRVIESHCNNSYVGNIMSVYKCDDGMYAGGYLGKNTPTGKLTENYVDFVVDSKRKDLVRYYPMWIEREIENCNFFDDLCPFNQSWTRECGTETCNAYEWCFAKYKNCMPAIIDGKSDMSCSIIGHDKCYKLCKSNADCELPLKCDAVALPSGDTFYPGAGICVYENFKYYLKGDSN